MSHTKTEAFFDNMSRTYERDLREIGWDPVAVIRDWPFIAMPKQTVLDAGCGTGLVLEHFSGADRKLIGFDLSERMVERARRRSSLRDTELFVHSVDEPWPVPDASVDRVVCIAVLEFIPKIEEVFDEIDRVLRPGGKALISVEAKTDAEGREMPAYELRYGELPMWKRTQEEVEMALPLTLRSTRYETQPAYKVVEYDYTCMYHFAELEKQT
jgi:ubiquinone/menaquinone biosynthesis C-methylase UbiE